MQFILMQVHGENDRMLNHMPCLIFMYTATTSAANFSSPASAASVVVVVVVVVVEPDVGWGSPSRSDWAFGRAAAVLGRRADAMADAQVR